MTVRVLGAILLLGAVSACATAAAPRAAPPALAVPAPDRTMIIPTTLEPAPDPVVADNEPVEEAPPAVRPARPAPRAAAPNPEPPTAETPETPPVVLTTGNAGELAARAEQHLTRARQSLSRVAVNQLGRDGRAQYDEVRRFIRLAEEKLRTRNYVYANELAERAALLASLLSRD